MTGIMDWIKKQYWKIPIPISWKVWFRNKFPQNNDYLQDQPVAIKISTDTAVLSQYCDTILNIPTDRSFDYCDYIEHKTIKRKAKLCAYYLTQYHPTEKNNLWWGKGTTEWTNVSKAVAQFAGHYQPRLPGELGFYDLRIEENMMRQIELAKNYGVDVFSFYYYWFNGERALEKPLDMFLNNKNMKIEFNICWCNEDWTKRYSGSSSEVLLSVGKTQDSYVMFIKSVLSIFEDPRYLTIDGRPVLTIYRPSEIPDCERTLTQWRQIVKQAIGKELYLIASQEANILVDWTKKGFDAISQFQPASIMNIAKNITDHYKFIRTDFAGKIYDYNSIAADAVSKINQTQKIYPAVMPMWDNTSRRNNKGIIFENATPSLYGKWLTDAINYVRSSRLDDNLVFINAWNEWGEGAYLEPDRRYGYAFLEETFKANIQSFGDD